MLISTLRLYEATRTPSLEGKEGATTRCQEEEEDSSFRDQGLRCIMDSSWDINSRDFSTDREGGTGLMSRKVRDPHT